MSGVKINLNMSVIQRAVGKAASLKINRIAHSLRAEIARRLSVSAQEGGRRRDAKGKFRRAKYVASKPGDYPRLRTGALRQSINVQPSTPTNLRAYVGTPLLYGKYLELGTKNIEARPFLVNTFLDMQPRIELILRDRRK